MLGFGAVSLAGCGGGKVPTVNGGTPSATPFSASPGGESFAVSPPPSPSPLPPPSIPAPSAPQPLPTTPAWLVGVPTNRWVEIPGTVLAGSAGAPGENSADFYAASNIAIRAYSGMALREDISEVWVAAAGGHSDSSDNAVRSIVLAVDAPAWQLRSAASAMADRRADSAYYADGKPTSRHTYWSTQWSSTRQRLMLHRTRYSYGNALSFEVTNGFNPATDTWDPQGTYKTPVQSAHCRDASDNVWAMNPNDNAMYKWTVATDTWTKTGAFGGTRFPFGPMVYAADRSQFFALAWSDGQDGWPWGFDQINAWIISGDGTSRQPISFNASAAYAQFASDKPGYAALEYDPDNRRFLFYDARGAKVNRIYFITPNAGTVWDMSLLPLDPAGVTPADAGPGGLMNKFRYVPALKGFVLFTSAVNNLYFLRTA